MSVKTSTECVRSFGRCAAGTSVVYWPTTKDEVRDVFAAAKTSGRRVAVRAGGHSFDGQAVHDRDDGKQIILSAEAFDLETIEFDPGGKTNTVRLGAGVPWGGFVAAAIRRARDFNEPIRIPGSMQTGRKATAGGTLSGDCLSRFSGTVGKESRWIDSFRMLTTGGDCLDVNEASHPDLFNAVIGGHGYIGFVTDVTYKLVSVDRASCARTAITRHTSFRELIAKQIELVQQATGSSEPVAVSAAWFTDTIVDTPPPRRIKGGVFKSTYAKPSDPALPGFPLYSGIDCDERYWTELMARIDLLNLAIHEILFQVAGEDDGTFENDLIDFLFFMDGNTVAKEKFEKRHKPQQFPIVQQTFIVPPDRAEAFAENCEAKMRLPFHARPTECDMLFVRSDDCYMSGSYQLDGFAISLGFEPIAPEGCPPDNIPSLLYDLSRDCKSVGGRLHLVKNVYAEPDVFRAMFSPQIEIFEGIKRKYDPDLILQNPFSDKFFEF